MDKLLPTILAALMVAGITSLVVVYGDVGKIVTDVSAIHRDVDRLEQRMSVIWEAHARLEERTKVRPCKQ